MADEDQGGIERPCRHGQHRSIEDALRCVELEKLGDASFGSIDAGENLWWGSKDTPNMSNLGMVIGLWNRAAGIRWRLDYDPVKKMHINQENLNADSKNKKIYHPIFVGHILSIYDEEYWMRHYWKLWTNGNTDKLPPQVMAKLGGKTRWMGRFWA
jgi:hypothetical protein